MKAGDFITARRAKRSLRAARPASNALACANMALAGYDAVIPLDEVITTMDLVGKMLPVELRCTALGGLSVTPTSQEIASRLDREGLQRS